MLDYQDEEPYAGIQHQFWETQLAAAKGPEEAARVEEICSVDLFEWADCA